MKTGTWNLPSNKGVIIMKELDYVKHAKNQAKIDAQLFLSDICDTAEDLMIDQDWYIEEVLKAFHKLRAKKE